MRWGMCTVAFRCLSKCSKRLRQMQRNIKISRSLKSFWAITLLAILSPFMLLAGLLVAVDVGFPLFFWQQRPGLRNKTFRLYKFRTMRPTTRSRGEARLTHKSRDHARISAVIGPRPLLPDDQPKDGLVRLSVRPGITRWAQVHGGDLLTAEEKLVLDHWYIRHMSFVLDVRIAIKTLIVTVKGDKPEPEMIEAIRKELYPTTLEHRSDRG